MQTLIFSNNFHSQKIQRKYNKEIQFNYLLMKRYFLPLISLILSIWLMAYLMFSFFFDIFGSNNVLTFQLTVWYFIFITMSIASIIIQLVLYSRPLSSMYMRNIPAYINSTLLYVIIVIYYCNSSTSLFSLLPLVVIAMINFAIQLLLVHFQIIQLNELIGLSIAINLLITIIDTKLNRVIIQLYLILLALCSYISDKRNKSYFIKRYNDKLLKDKEDSFLTSETNGVMKIKDNKIVYINVCLSKLLFEKSTVLAQLSLSKREYSHKIENMVEIMNKYFNDIINELIGNVKQNSLIHYNSSISELEFENTIIEDHIDFLNDNNVTNDNTITTLNYFKDKYSKQSSSSTQFISSKVTSSLINRIRYKYTPDTNSFTIIFYSIKEPTNPTTQDKEEIKTEALFISKIAHEFKNPLITINELLDTIEETKIDTPLSDQQNLLFNLIRSFTLYLFTLAKDMESYSQFRQKKKIQLSLSIVNIEDIIKFIKQIADGLLSRYSNDKKISFEVIIDSIVPKVIYTDGIRLRQILINLISNSIKFTDKGSVVLHVSEDDNALKFSVTDTGKGFDKAQLKNIFIPFEKIAKNNSIGSGLGLCIVRELSIALGQEIHFTSHINDGSTFWFMIPMMNSNGKSITTESEYEREKLTLQMNNSSKEINTNTSTPLYIERQLTSKLSNFSSDKTISVPLQKLCFKTNEFNQWDNEKPSQCPNSNRTMSILVVDDDDFVRKSVIRTIKSYTKKNNISIEIIEASDGLEGISYLSKANEKKIDLIISDENMKHCNGSEFFQYMNKLVNDNIIPKIPFVILSGDSDIANKNFGESNVKSYTKPINESIVQSLFSEYIEC